MGLIEENLDQEGKVITVWFNAWRYEKEKHPIVPLVGTIVKELERHKGFTDRLSDNGRSLIRSLRAVAYGFSAKTKVRVPGFAEIEASFVVKEMIDREEHLTTDPLLDRSLYYQAFESLSSVQLPDDVRIVVLIDDLDRCMSDIAIRLLESIKLILSQPGFIYVLGVARQVLEGYLEHRYAEDFGIKGFEGQRYLDKIIQLPFYIPPHHARRDNLSKAVLSQLDDEKQRNEVDPKNWTGG
jgi:predicted KAP-like P-loop ATPase